jgi:hypothetical protein
MNTLVWVKRGDSEFAIDNKNMNLYEIYPVNNIFYLSVNGVTRMEGTKKVCKAFAESSMMSVMVEN